MAKMVINVLNTFNLIPIRQKPAFVVYFRVTYFFERRVKIKQKVFLSLSLA
jgi:hypothetical protein